MMNTKKVHLKENILKVWQSDFTGLGGLWVLKCPLFFNSLTSARAKVKDPNLT